MPSGLDCYFYRDTGTYGSPVWTLQPAVRDLSKSGETGMADGSSRTTRFKTWVRTLKDIGLSFGYVKKTADATNYAAWRSAWLADTDLDLAIADGPIATTGTNYVRIQMGISKWEETEPLENVVMAQIELKVTDGDTHPPAVVTVS